jgi:hypothetical protein
MASDVDIAEARELYELAIDADQPNREQAMVDLRFSALEGQWDDRIKAQRDRERRPCFVYDRTGQIVRQIVGDMRLNPPGIVVRPQDNAADPKLAKTLTGLIRNIESVSTADAHYTTAADNAVRCGMGFLRVRYDYVDDCGFDMDFRIEAITSPFGAVCDPGAVLPTREDADYWFVDDLWTRKAFEKRWPKASLDGWDVKALSTWRDGDFVRVAEYWRKVPKRKHLLSLANGATADVTDLDDNEIGELVQQAGGWKRERWVDGHKICMSLMNGSEQLEKTYDWPGSIIPIAPVWGEEIHLGDRTVRRGVIRAARDAQIRYNVQATAMTEAIALAPKAKWLVTLKQIAAHKEFWDSAHLNNYPYLPYTVDGQAPPPTRMQPEPPPAGLLAEVQAAAMDIEATTGVYRENLGKESNAISGRAILSRQREGDVGTYLYADNLSRAVQHIGRILVDAMPRVYDTERTIRILGEDGSTEFAEINQRVMDPATGQQKIINDLAAGRYDVAVSTGPAFSTRREEARESMMAFMQADPSSTQMVADLFAQYQDWPGAEEIAERLRKRAVASGIAEPKEGEQPPGPPPPDPNMVLAQAEVMKAEAAMARAQADAAKAQAEAQLKASEVEIDKASLAIEVENLRLKQRDLELKIAEARANAVDKKRQTDIKEAQAVQDAVRNAMEDLRMQQEQRDRGLMQIAETMNAAARTMSAPRRIKRDQRGKAIGVEIDG